MVRDEYVDKDGRSGATHWLVGYQRWVLIGAWVQSESPATTH